MKEFIFDNAEKKQFVECSDEEKLEIITAKIYGRCETFDPLRNSWKESQRDVIFLEYKYRTLKPAHTPNQIDWGQFPPWTKSCATDKNGETYIFSASTAKELKYDGEVWEPSDWLSDCKQIEITDFPGFKRGTVAPEDSLLIRPEGK